jgi:hypothetical protein
MQQRPVAALVDMGFEYMACLDSTGVSKLLRYYETIDKSKYCDRVILIYEYSLTKISNTRRDGSKPPK